MSKWHSSAHLKMTTICHLSPLLTNVPVQITIIARFDDYKSIPTVLSYSPVGPLLFILHPAKKRWFWSTNLVMPSHGYNKQCPNSLPQFISSCFFWLRNTIYGHMGASRTTLGHTVLWIMVWLLRCGVMPCIAYLIVRSSPALPTSPDSSAPLWWTSGWFNIFILLCFFFLISYPPNLVWELGPPTESKIAFKLGWPNVANKMQDT